MPQEVYDQTPAGARGAAGTRTVHWVLDPVVNGTFFDGALWAFSFSFDQLFGEVLGPELFDQATQLERWDGTGWVPLA